MAGKYVRNAAGVDVWVEDGTTADNSASGDPGSPQGLVMGAPHKPAGGGIYGPSSSNTNPGGLSAYKANLEAARLLWNDADNPNHINAAKVSPYALDRSTELGTRAQQFSPLARYKQASMGYGPSAAAGITQGGSEAALKAIIAARAPGGARAGLAAGSSMLGQNALAGAGMAGSEAQDAWKALTGGAMAVRGADLTAATDKAKMDYAQALADATYSQQAGLANQGADVARLGNRIAAASQYGGIVADNRSADTATFGFGLDQKRHNDELAQAHQDASSAKTAEYLKLVARISTLGAGGGG